MSKQTEHEPRPGAGDDRADAEGARDAMSQLSPEDQKTGIKLVLWIIEGVRRNLSSSLMQAIFSTDPDTKEFLDHLEQTSERPRGEK